MSLLLALVVATAPNPSWTQLGLAPSLRRVLDAGNYGSTPPGFRAITLSHLADGCVGQARRRPEVEDAARACVSKAVEQGLALHDFTCSSEACDLSGVDPLFAAHLLLVLGAADQLGGCGHADLHLGLARQLAAESLAQETGVVPSYRSLPLQWPADQTALLAGLGRIDAAHGTALLAEPLERFERNLDAKGLHKSGLPQSELTGAGPGAGYPRGCANSFITRYLAEVDAPRAAAWWKLYRAKYFTDLAFGVVGFREWPPGVSGFSDTDSGPVVLGIGTAASALAVSAAKANGDASTAAKLEKSAERVMSLGIGSDVVHAAFAEAIRFEGRWHGVPRD